MPIRATHNFTNTIGCLVERGDNKSLITHTQTCKRVADPFSLQNITLYEQRCGMNHNMTGKVCLDMWEKCPGPKLRKCVVTAVRCNHIMTSLGATVIAHDNTSINVTNKKICQESFSGISETKINDNVRAQRMVAPPRLFRRLSG